MAIAYIPPGVDVEELFSPSVNPLLTDSANICLVGATRGYTIESQSVVVPPGTNPVTITVKNAGEVITKVTNTQTFVSVTNAINPVLGNAPNQAGYIEGPATTTATTTVSSNIASGVTSIPVTSSNGFVTGQSVVLGGTTETRTITSIPDTTHIVVNAVTTNAHNSGDSVTEANIPTNNDFTASVAGNGATVTITPNSGGSLSVGGTINLVYRVIPINYYVATRCFSQAAVEQLYGPAFTAAGIQTPVSAAAAFAFENGASSIVIQPLYVLTDSTNPGSVRLGPSAAQAATASSAWAQTLFGLRDIEDINIIVPVVGQTGSTDPYYTSVTDSLQLNILEAVQDHLYYQQTQGQYLVAVMGEDSSGDVTVATATTLQSHAGTLSQRYGGTGTEALIFVSPSRFTRPLPSVSGATINVGGQYLAASIAGMLAARNVASSITRKQVAGYTAVADTRGKAGKDADGQAGLLVIEQKGSSVQVRHAITINSSTVATRELSVVRAKYHMISSLVNSLDSQIVGQVNADGNAPTLVKSLVIGVLELLKSDRELVAYSGVQARLLTSDPTTCEVRFSYQPAFPLNFIEIIFSLDLTGSTTGITTTTV